MQVANENFPPENFPPENFPQGPPGDVITVKSQPGAMPGVPIRPAARGWERSEADLSRCVVGLGDEALEEVTRLATELRAHPLPILMCVPHRFEMPHLRLAMARAKHCLDEGLGVAIIHRLALDDFGPEEAKRIFWILGQLLAPPVAQTWDGIMLYEVTDKGKPYGYGVRGSYTNIELVFHTDNAFGVCPPQYVGLLCVHTALQGGSSRFCSLAAVHDRMLERHPRSLERLFQPMLWDRQAEHAPDAPRVASAPMFRFEAGRLRVRANTSLVRKGYEVAGVKIGETLDRALNLFRATTEDPTMWVEYPMERGQIQYVNNLDIGHYRSEYQDHPDPAKHRCLLRSWHRPYGRTSYDGE